MCGGQQHIHGMPMIFQNKFPVMRQNTLAGETPTSIVIAIHEMLHVYSLSVCAYCTSIVTEAVVSIHHGGVCCILLPSVDGIHTPSNSFVWQDVDP
jgi:hypothetical protein